MATSDEVKALRALLGPAVGEYTDPQLSDMLDAAGGDVNVVAANLWSGYASSSATLVNISESGSSRSMGDIYKNAMAMAKYFRGLSEDVTATADSRPRTRRIERV